MKILCVLLYFSYSIYITSALEFDCDYKPEDFVILKEKYRCEVKKDFKITSKNSTLITNVTDSHKKGKSNDDVAVFKVHKLTVNYFPTGLAIFFKNLEGIVINSCELKEVHQDDLKVFPNLIYLDLGDNEIKIIEAETFKYNRNLKLIWLKRNKIFHIDLNAFNGLEKLTNLNLLGNNCTNLKAINAVFVKKVVEILNDTCISQEYLERKRNDSITVKLDAAILKNETLVNIDHQPANNFESILNSIKELNENFSKTQEFFTNLAKKVDKIEQNLAKTTNNLTEFHAISTKTSNETLETLESIKESQLLSDSSNQCEYLIETTSNDLKDTLQSIQDAQSNIFQALQDLKKSQEASPTSNPTQNLTIVSDNLEQVKKTLNDTKTSMIETIQTNAESTTLELAKLKMNIHVIENKIASDVVAELKAVRSYLENIKKEIKEKIELTAQAVDSSKETTAQATDSSKDTTTQAADNSKNSTTQAADNSREATVQAADNSRETTTQVADNSTESTAQATDNSKESTTLASNNSIDSTTQAADNSKDTTTQAADNSKDTAAQVKGNSIESTSQAADNSKDTAALSTDNLIDSSTQAVDNSKNSSTQATDNTEETTIESQSFSN